MADDYVELFWFMFCIIRAGFLLLAFSAVALLCRWLLRRIPRKSVKRPPFKDAIVHSFGTLRLRNLDASQPKAIDQVLSERDERIG